MVHAIRNLYKEVYGSTGKISKRDKLGIFAKIENSVLDSFSLCIETVYKTRAEKKPSLEKMRTEIEITKQLIRASYEMKIIDEKKYIHFAEMLQEISKMTNGWIKYLETQNPPMRRM